MKTKKGILSLPILSVGICLAASGAQAALVDGLLNYWTLDGNANDSAGSYAGSASTVADNGAFAGANGTGGISYAAGLFGQSTLQDGAVAQNNGFVNVPNSVDILAGGESLTISIWARVSTFDTNWQALIAHGEGSDYRIARRAGDSVVGYAGGTGDIPGSAIGPVINDGAWHNIVAVTENGVSTRLWVDGGLVATSAAAPLIVDSVNSLSIGANPGSGAQNREWAGNLDDIGMWNRPLSDIEIGQIWGGGPSSARSLGNLIIPEPSAGLLALVGIGLCIRRRR